MCDIASALPPHTPWTPATQAILSYLNYEIAKESLLSPNNGGRNREVECPGSFEGWTEITTGWAGSSTAALSALQGVACKRKRPPVNYNLKAGDIVSEIVHSAVIYLGNPLLYLILQLEAFKQTCAGPAKQLDTKDFLVVHRLECIYTKKPTFSPSFFLERIRFKVSFLTLHTKTPHPTINNRFLPTPSVTFPVYSRPDRDEPRELPADHKQDIIDSALTIPRWAPQQQLCSSRIDRNFLR